MTSAKAYFAKLDIPTYEVLAPDLHPILDKKLQPYPYPLQNNRSAAKRNVTYDVIKLENEFLELTVIPSLGGRLYSMIDKRNGREILYRNATIKPRMIGTRGAWFAGGIEFNFPISHSPNTMDRVNCTVRQNGDGSASVIFGNIELISGMNWKVELRLHPGQTRLEQHVRLSNPTPHENRYYFWTNTAVAYHDSMELIYPFDWCVNNMAGKYGRWPYYYKLDCRRPKNIPFSFETFGKLMNDNFFGVYYHEQDYGLVHVADRKRLKGAKFFTWGTDAYGEAWNRALTDDGSQYIEIQSGPFETQRVYKFMKPYDRLSWVEYWYPVADMKGFDYAERELAVKVEPIGRSIRLAFAATEPLGDCRIVCSAGGKVQTVERNLSPAHTETVVFELDEAEAAEKLKLDVFSGGRRILSMGERDERSDEYPDPDIYEDVRVVVPDGNEHSLLKQAQFQESLGEFDEAVRLYEANLKVYPKCVVTLNRLAQLYLKSMQYDRAEACLRSVLAYDNRSGQARFLLACVCKAKGDLARARRLFMDIAADSEYAEASVLELVKLDIAIGYEHEAGMLLETLGTASPYAFFLAGITARKRDGAGCGASGAWLAASADSEASADEFILAERYLSGRSDRNRDELLAFTGADERVILPVVLHYVEMRLWDDAAALLELIPTPTMKSKWVALYLREQREAFRDEWLREAAAEPLDHVFVNEPVIADILRRYQAKDDTGVIDYLLGTYYYTIARKEEALALMTAAYAKGLRYVVLLHNLGYMHLHVKHDAVSAERYFAEALETGGAGSEAVLVWLDKIYAEQGNLEKRRELIPHMERASNKSLILVPLVHIYADSGEEEKALQLLQTHEFENWEGQESSGPAYRKVIIRLAMKALDAGDHAAAKQWIDRVQDYPPNLNYGDSALTALADVHYYKGLIYSKIGLKEEAAASFARGAAELVDDLVSKTDRSRKYSALCLEQLK
jgi:tetratricopeptide (TPR) repeat protein